jgi:hypothetical protein
MTVYSHVTVQSHFQGFCVGRTTVVAKRLCTASRPAQRTGICSPWLGFRAQGEVFSSNQR